ncbi:LppU/SCO3897 family protein [Mycobacterium seoulense]|uniref:Uncharacterized protein n=1 Tax=Mycobacterium seoulense TaxID=386911 RepID=A0A7I7P4Y8_9MYCO|nr:hypothetical protein [Mycobacterium seoulense]MCV7438026.1 hypothetical protein [Mycobacterium seoulense]BBY03062.1 hypothetical protein MSEO_35610 [Mycobacterium seoulense]
MTVVQLASEGPDVLAGRMIFLFGLPAIGLICLIIGLLERSRRRPPVPPPYNAGHPYPPAPPPTGYPGAYPVPPPYPGYPPAVPPRPRTSKSATTLITIGAVLLGLGGLNIFFHAARALSSDDRGSPTTAQPTPSTRAAMPEIGQCFTEFEVRMGSLNQPTDCGDPVATYELAAKGGPTTTCPDNKRGDSVYARLTNESHTLCFAANLKQGLCYLRTDQRETTTWTPVDCAEARFARFKVDKRIDGSADETQCPPGTTANAYPTPPRVYCLAQADS